MNQVAMRLLVVTRERAPDKRYGLGKSLAPIIEALRSRGIYVHYLCQEDAGQQGWSRLQRLHAWLAPVLSKIFRGTQCVALLWAIIERVNMGRLAVKVAQAERITHVHCHDPIIAYGFYRFWFFKSARPQFGITEHGFGSYAHAIHEDGAVLGAHVMRFLRRREAKILAKANWVSSPTQLGLQQLLRDLSLPNLPAHWHAIPPARPALSRCYREHTRAQLGVPDSGLLILGVGRLAPLKDFPTLLEGFALLCAAMPTLPLRLLILGDGDASAVMSIANKLALGDKVAIQVTDNIWPFYAAADIYVSTSRTESFGLANFEAVGMGLASICTAVGGVPEVLATACRLIPPQNPNALCNALQELITYPARRHYLAASGQTWLKTWPDANAIADQWLDVYLGRAHTNEHGLTNINSPSQGAVGLVEQQDPADVPALSFLAPRPLELVSDLRVLVLAPHADDETIGCGGTLAALSTLGARITLVVVTDGARGDPMDYAGGTVVETRRAEAREAMAILGIQEVRFLDLPDGELIREERLEDELARVLDAFQPDWLFLPSREDAHQDHVAVAMAVHRLRSTMCPNTRLLEYEIWHPIRANALIDITCYYPVKHGALQCYRLPLKYVDYLAGAEGLAFYRGISLPNGRGMAEAFLEYPPL